MVEKVDPLYVQFNKSIEALIQLQADEAGKAFAQAEQRYTTIRMISFVIFISGMLISGLFNLVLSRSITGQLGGESGEATRVTQGVGTGNLSVNIHLKQGDKTSLMASLKFMQENLGKVVSRVRKGAESLATVKQNAPKKAFAANASKDWETF